MNKAYRALDERMEDDDANAVERKPRTASTRHILEGDLNWQITMKGVDGAGVLVIEKQHVFSVLLSNSNRAYNSSVAVFLCSGCGCWYGSDDILQGKLIKRSTAYLPGKCGRHHAMHRWDLSGEFFDDILLTPSAFTNSLIMERHFPTQSTNPDEESSIRSKEMSRAWIVAFAGHPWRLSPRRMHEHTSSWRDIVESSSIETGIFH